jgi:hypothetical protein
MMSRPSAIALILWLLCPVLVAKPEYGTVCVVWNSTKPPKVISAGGSYNPATLKLRIDKRPPVLWPHKEDLRIDDLDLTERHLVVISDGKPIQSFWFRFSEFNSAELCMAFDG